MKEIKTIVTARKHRAFQPETKAHKQFLHSNLEKVKQLQESYPFLDLTQELKYFTPSAPDEILKPDTNFRTWNKKI